jgi:hypothetical protein
LILVSKDGQLNALITVIKNSIDRFVGGVMASSGIDFKALPIDHLMTALGIQDSDRLRSRLSGRKVLLLGAGDLARKKEIWICTLKNLGVDVYVADISKTPPALQTLEPYIKDFYLLGDPKAERELLKLGQTDPFDILDISTWGDSHLSMAMRFQDISRLLISTKPVDTNLDLLRTIYRYADRGSPIYRNLTNRFFVHDHYSGRWIIQKAASNMARWHQENGFVEEIQIYILETKSVDRQLARIDALKEGICLDLMPHAFRVLQALMPIGARWQTKNLIYQRNNLNLLVTGGAREHNTGSALEGKVETFAAISLHGEDLVHISGASEKTDQGRTGRYPFNCLVVVGKGVAGNSGDERDVKGISMKFQTGNFLEIDFESQRLKEPDGTVVLPPKDIVHRGINSPLIEIAKTHIDSEQHNGLSRHLQLLHEAYTAMELIDRARHLRWLGQSYEEGAGCVNLINKIPREWWGGIEWQLTAMPHIQIGAVSDETLLVP